MPNLLSLTLRRRVAFAASAAAAFLILLVPTASATPILISGQMEGDLRMAPGDTLHGGYHLSMPGTHAAAETTLAGAKIDLPWTCLAGPGSGTVTLPLTTGPYSIGMNVNDWIPANDQHDPANFMGQMAVPDLCNGGTVRFQQGAFFAADVRSTNTVDTVKVQFHYGPTGSSFSWSPGANVIPSGPPTAVVLTSLHAARSPLGVVVRWRTAQETGLVGFNVYRGEGSRRVRLNAGPIVAAAGPRAWSHSLIDRRAPKRPVRYAVEAVYLDGHTVSLGTTAAR